METNYNTLLEENTKLKKEIESLKGYVMELENLLELLNSNVPTQKTGNTPIENRRAQGKMTGEWTSYDKMENFDIFN